MPTVRNPLAGFALTIVGALGLAFLVGVPFILFVPQFDRGLIYFYLPFALFGAGFFAGRTTFLGSDRKSTRLNSSHGYISYAVFCLKKKNHQHPQGFVC